MSYTLKQIASRLDEFGSAAEIAAQFAILGIRGARSRADACPIAELIYGVAVMPPQSDAGVDSGIMDIRAFVRGPTGRFTRVLVESSDTPRAASIFVDEFDSGLYQELEL